MSFGEFHFELVDGQTTMMRPSDMGRIAHIDSSNAHSKVSLLISSYLGVGDASSSRETKYVTAPRQEVLNSLAEDPDFTGGINTFIKAMLKNYVVNGTLPFATLGCVLMAMVKEQERDHVHMSWT